MVLLETKTKEHARTQIQCGKIMYDLAGKTHHFSFVLSKETYRRVYV